jgi:hypothetical protein
MKKLLCLLVVLAVAGVCMPAMAQVEKTIILFRSMDDPDIPPDPEVMMRAPFWDPEWDPLDPPPFVVPLGYSTWSMNSRSKDGIIVNEKVRQTGGGTLVAIITDPNFLPGSVAPAYSELAIGDLFLTVEGECQVMINPMLPPDPELGPLFMSCYTTVVPENSTPGIKWGQATSNSNFLPGIEIPGFETGSFWSVQLIWEGE